MKAKPVCFVAMAFGREDTDILYDKHILPVLKELGVKPIIINRQEKNDDLNIQIIEELSKCDFAIADLTYARQSVYFEAGFAQRAVEVIYTVRKDHLKRNSPDNLRVHFDLQMKPLIIWEDLNDKNFSKKLARRLKATVLKKWIHQKNVERSVEVSRRFFGMLPQVQKIRLIRKVAIQKLKNIRSGRWLLWPSYPNSHLSFTVKQIKSGLANDIFSSKRNKNSLVFVTINSYPSATKSILNTFNLHHAVGEFVRIEDSKDNEELVSINIHHFIFSLRRIPISRIHDVYPSFFHTSNLQIYSRDYNSNYFYWLRKRNMAIEVTVDMHFISGIDSEMNLKEIMQNHVNECNPSLSQ